MADNTILNDQNQKHAGDESFDTAGFLLELLAHWKWVAISVIALLIGAYFYIHTIVPVYQVDASIYLNSNDSQTKDAFSLDPNNPLISMKSYIDETELEVLKSRNNVIEIVNSLGMAYSYWSVGKLRDVPMYEDYAISAKLDSVSLSVLTSPITIIVDNGSQAEKFDVEVKTSFKNVEEEKSFSDITLPYDIELSHGTVTLERVTQVPELLNTEKIVINNPESVAAALSAGLDIQFAEKAPTIVRIAYSTTTPQQGVDVINTLVDFYNRQIIEDKNRSAVQTEAFILDRLVMINDELRDVEQRLQEYRQTHNVTDLNKQVQNNITTQTATEGQLAQIEAELAMINSIESVIRQADVYTNVPSVTKEVALTQIIEAYNKRVNQLNRMLESSTPDNPLVMTLQDELTRDKARILQNIVTVRQSLEARRNNVASIENRTMAQLSSVAPIDKGLQEIFREQQVKVNIYTFLLQKREEIALQKTMATPTARLIDDPLVSAGPISPRRMIIYFMALLLGLGIPAAWIFIRRYFFPTFKDQEELQRLTDVPVISEICIDHNKDNRAIVVGEDVSTSIAELFRLLRNNIRFTKNGAEKKVILVTSSISGEGKTFVATNLAVTYALAKKRVLVAGMDIRRPMLAHSFGFDNHKGATTFLSGQTTNIDDIIFQSAESPNLYVMPAGPVPPNPNELLMSDNMTKLMAQIRERFDVIILDTAPIGLISDSFLIVPYSDIQLYVTRASYSSKNALKTLHEAVRLNRLPEAYIVLNGVNMATGSYNYRKYGHYNNSGQHSYGYGYTSDTLKDKKPEHTNK